jgi:hypothetical protein
MRKVRIKAGNSLKCAVILIALFMTSCSSWMEPGQRLRSDTSNLYGEVKAQPDDAVKSGNAKGKDLVNPNGAVIRERFNTPVGL